MYQKFFIEMDDLLLLPIGNKTFVQTFRMEIKRVTVND